MLYLEIGNLPKKDQVYVKQWLSKLRKKLQEARKTHGFTQESLAEHLEISVNTIKYIEQGRRLPSLPLMLRLCKALKVKVSLS